MMISITKLELQFLEEALETIIEEFEGFEECSDPSNYVITTGADALAREALLMLRKISQEVERDADTLSDS